MSQHPYIYMWDGTQPWWSLGRLVVDGVDSYFFFNEADRTIKLIEDDSIALEVKERMLEAGVPVRDAEYLREHATHVPLKSVDPKTFLRKRKT